MFVQQSLALTQLRVVEKDVEHEAGVAGAGCRAGVVKPGRLQRFNSAAADPEPPAGGGGGGLGASAGGETGDCDRACNEGGHHEPTHVQRPRSGASRRGPPGPHPRGGSPVRRIRVARRGISGTIMLRTINSTRAEAPCLASCPIVCTIDYNNSLGGLILKLRQCKPDHGLHSPEKISGGHEVFSYSCARRCLQNAGYLVYSSPL